jgi:hypothetical protein
MSFPCNGDNVPPWLGHAAHGRRASCCSQCLAVEKGDYYLKASDVYNSICVRPLWPDFCVPCAEEGGCCWQAGAKGRSHDARTHAWLSGTIDIVQAFFHCSVDCKGTARPGGIAGRWRPSRGVWAEERFGTTVDATTSQGEKKGARQGRQAVREGRRRSTQHVCCPERRSTYQAIMVSCIWLTAPCRTERLIGCVAHRVRSTRP